MAGGGGRSAGCFSSRDSRRRAPPDTPAAASSPTPSSCARGETGDREPQSAPGQRWAPRDLAERIQPRGFSAPSAGPLHPATQHGRSPGAQARVRWPGAPVLHGASVHCSGRAVRVSPAILPGATCPPSGPRARPPGPSSSQGQPHNAAGPSGSPDPGSRGRSPATQGPELDCSAGLAVREDRRVPCREGGRGSRADRRAEDGGGKQGHVAGAPTSGA